MAPVLAVLVYAVAIAVSTLVLAASLFMIEDRRESSFRGRGRAAAWGKCAKVSAVMILMGMVPFGPLLALVAFFVGVMVLFEKTFLQAFVLLLINGIFSYAVAHVIAKFAGGA